MELCVKSGNFLHVIIDDEFANNRKKYDWASLSSFMSRHKWGNTGQVIGSSSHNKIITSKVFHFLVSDLSIKTWTLAINRRYIRLNVYCPLSTSPVVSAHLPFFFFSLSLSLSIIVLGFGVICQQFGDPFSLKTWGKGSFQQCVFLPECRFWCGACCGWQSLRRGTSQSGHQEPRVSQKSGEQPFVEQAKHQEAPCLKETDKRGQPPRKSWARRWKATKQFLSSQDWPVLLVFLKFISECSRLGSMNVAKVLLVVEKCMKTRENKATRTEIPHSNK